MRKTELPISAGSLDVLRTAVVYGADAVYIGGEAFGLWAKAHNFSDKEMKQGIVFAHTRGVKVHVTANIPIHSGDLPGVEAYFKEVEDVASDAFIISDPGAFTIIRRVLPHMEIHIGTQANSVNYGTYLFWYRLGAGRMVPAGELSPAGIREIQDHIPQDMRIESFIYGVVCISYPGRYLPSNYFVGRDANQGAYTHPCRQKYSSVEETRPGEYMPTYEDERGTHIFSSKNLCMVEYIPEMMDTGINSFKVEGRTKATLYVATITRAYHEVIDDYLKDSAVYRENPEWYRGEIEKCTSRRSTIGFCSGKPAADDHIYDSSAYVKNYTYLGIVGETDSLGQRRTQQKNKLSVGETIEVMKPDEQNLTATVESMTDEEGSTQKSAPHLKQTLWIRLLSGVSACDILRRKEEIEDQRKLRTGPSGVRGGKAALEPCRFWRTGDTMVCQMEHSLGWQCFVLSIS